MATIDKLDFKVYVDYARRTRLIELVNKDYGLGQSQGIGAQIEVVDIHPRVLELDLLIGLMRQYAPWASFWPPKKFQEQRRPVFMRHRIAPSLGTFSKQDADYETVLNFSPETKEQETEQRILCTCFQQIHTINGWKIGRAHV